MRTKKITTLALKDYIIQNTVVTMPDLKRFLHSASNMTIYRRLKELSYLSSCSHQGKYYSLTELAYFDKDGLWFYDKILFSIYGTLIKTCQHFVRQRDAGYSIFELRQKLRLAVKEPLLTLYQKKELAREAIAGQMIYFSIEPSKKRSQILLRKERSAPRALNSGKIGPHLITDEMRAATILFYSVLDERQRRLYAGLESIKLGFGGDQIMADYLKLDPHTVSKGRQELATENFQRQRIRKPGGGRKSIKKNA
jgi:hypothetical protein